MKNHSTIQRGNGSGFRITKSHLSHANERWLFGGIFCLGIAGPVNLSYAIRPTARFRILLASSALTAPSPFMSIVSSLSASNEA